MVDQKSGEQSEQQITLGKLIREIALGDQRMGRSLDAVRTAARIEGSLKAAEEAGGEWEISDEDYALLRECFEAPSSGYNPHIGRMSLPVLEYFMAAGNAEQD